MSEWRSVEDKKPSGHVLVCTQFGEVTVADYAATGWWREGGKMFHAKITHWMPLPEPPEQP